MATDSQIWQHLLEAVSGFVRKRVPAADADDVVQDIFLRAHRDVGSLRQKSRAEAWLFAIARRAVADFYRKRQHQSHVSAAEEIPDAVDERTQSPENLSSYSGEHDVHEEVLSWLRPTADEIDEPYRTALIRADFDKVSQRDLAKELNLSESGLKSRVQRGRKMLADALKRCCEIEFGPDGRAVAFLRLRGCDCEN